ncbi:hypothetical protein LCGC14_2798080 [marine sediment metagenome]|uniref:DUF2815 family protein n=1 Tax=marine sediment metagenome TaxID=412755 RepID=A0A0F9AX71_9ZZZZ
MSEKKVEDHVIMLPNVRMAFPQIFTPSQVNNEGKPAFSASFLFPPIHPVVVIIQAAITKVANAKWGEKGPEILKALIAGDKVCLHNGDSKSQYDGFVGNLFVSARSPTRPGVFAQDPQVTLVEADGKPYSGCYVNAQIALWAQANNFGKRVNAQLRGVQFLRDGEAFGGGAVAQADEFDVVEGAEADAAAPEAVGGAWDPTMSAIPEVIPGGTDTGDWGDLIS